MGVCSSKFTENEQANYDESINKIKKACEELKKECEILKQQRLTMAIKDNPSMAGWTYDQVFFALMKGLAETKKYNKAQLVATQNFEKSSYFANFSEEVSNLKSAIQAKNSRYRKVYCEILRLEKNLNSYENTLMPEEYESDSNVVSIKKSIGRKRHFLERITHNKERLQRKIEDIRVDYIAEYNITAEFPFPPVLRQPPTDEEMASAN